jgi:hypothetical protein
VASGHLGAGRAARGSGTPCGLLRRHRGGREVSLEENAPLLDDSKNGWSIYRSEGQGYMLRYPKGWNLVEAKAGEGIQGTEESLTLLGREIEKASSWSIPSGRGPTVPFSAHHAGESGGKRGEI